MKKDFYIYEWFNVETGEVFYVGKGRAGRWKDTTKRNNYFKNYYNKYECDVRKIKTDMNEQEAFDMEALLINKYRECGECQCNLTDGGEGTTFEDGSWYKVRQRLIALVNNRKISEDQQGWSNTYTLEEYQPYNLNFKTLEELEDMWEAYKDHKGNVTTGLHIIEMLTNGEWGYMD